MADNDTGQAGIAQTRYADVIVDIAVEKLDHTFQYRIPGELLGMTVPGSCVVIPFGRGGRTLKGYVLDITDTPCIPQERIKDIISVITDDGLVESALVKLAAWMSKNYGSTMAASLRVVFPVKSSVKKRETTYLHLAGDELLWNERLAFYEKKRQVARLRLLRELIDQREIPKSLVLSKLNVAGSVIGALKEQGLCTEDSGSIRERGADTAKKEIRLNDSQRAIADGIKHDIDEGILSPTLIRGVTGSGKTEIYIDIVSHVTGQGKGAIVLIPEISLTFQTLIRFYNRFGDRVATINSRLSKGERYDIFERAGRGELDVVIGPRSALFTPFKRLGVIIIDEEHEGSYKSEQMPKYHARETAIYRASLQGAKVIMGSATPSVDSYYRAENGEYELYELLERAESAKLPGVYITDLRREFEDGNKSPFGRLLREKIRNRLDEKQQVMLFLNRRGYAGFVSCRKCGYVFRCPHCDVSLSAHRNGRLVCHYCGYEQVYKKLCPKCGSRFVGAMKAGTEAIEKAVCEAFPDARVLRMDMDTTKTKDGHEKILTAFANHEADILVGTQMIVKGHDFPLVTLVGVLNADLSLHASDYRAGERTFQLLTQAAGRAGRGQIRGEVVIQTYSPKDPHILAAASQDYGAFYEREIAFRTLMGYPPAEHLLCVLYEGKDSELTDAEAKRGARLCNDLNKDMGFSVIGPSAATVAYIKDIHRRMLYIKCGDMEVLTSLKDVLEGDRNKRADIPVKIQFDFDPVNGY